MTRVFKFIVEQVGNVIDFCLSLKFELFDNQVSMLSILIAIVIMTMVIRLLLFGINEWNNDYGHISFKRSENKEKESDSKWI